MSDYIRKLLLCTFIKKASNNSVIRRFAHSLVRRERVFTGESMSVLVNATAKEIQSDLNNIFGKLFPKKDTKEETTGHNSKVLSGKEDCRDQKRQ
ncbi:unnamed protein product [Phytomonas sp. Hart1]|nr:unnamed protein product [Phytomonas sp. Hart1]|eukprot:CCW70860.1 unnamed protein product [Phytomonas sp. isolate Hart1]